MNLPFTLDQLLVFVTVVDTGSLSQAARQLHRTQSAISKNIAGLESQLDIKLFERSAQGAALTEAGAALVLSAKEALAGRDLFAAEAARVKGAASRIVSLAIDVLFPIAPVLDGLAEIEQSHDDIPIIIHTEALTRLVELVATGICSAGIVGPHGSRDAQFEREYLSTTWMVPVCTSTHPLAEASRKGSISQATLHEYTHIYMTDRVVETAPYKKTTERKWWKTTSLLTKLDCLERGLGWGLMPHHRIESHLAAGTLLALPVEGWPQAWSHEQYLITRRDAPPSPVTAALLAEIRARVAADGSSTGEWKP